MNPVWKNSRREEEGDGELLTDLRKCQREIVSHRKKCDRKIEEIEENYAERVKPHLHHRSSLTQCIPGFWFRSIMNHPLLPTVFEPGEWEVLSYLQNLEIDEDARNRDRFKIHFSFRKNPFFENQSLTKEFNEHGSINCQVLWKKGQRFPRTTKHDLWEEDDLGLACKGFFRWFFDPSEHYCDPIADIIKTSIWYNPLEFYDGSQISSVDVSIETRKTVREREKKIGMSSVRVAN